jgi:hypothetical protein
MKRSSSLATSAFSRCSGISSLEAVLRFSPWNIVPMTRRESSLPPRGAEYMYVGWVSTFCGFPNCSTSWSTLRISPR